mmetsp:Transcript_17994/g.40898  ORF Transcript_17994/g.40898 Transcript_17994/m.40898 type:complete len:373 (-) Transcript_17994:777-1895(-)
MTNLLVLHGATVAVATSALWNTGLIGQLVEIFLNQPPTALMALFVLLLMLVHFIVAFTATHLAEKEDQEDPEESEPSSKRRMTWIPEAPERNLGMEPDMFDPTDYPLAAIARANDDKESFLALYPCLKDSLLQSMEDSDMPPEAVEWAREALDYTVLGGKCNRGITVVTVHRALTRAQQGRNLTLIEVARAGVLGWAIEFLQAFFLVADDIMDDSQTRRGQPCWYKVPKVGMIAINDSFLLESFVFSLLRQHFGHEDYYSDLMDLFVRVTQKTVFGQLLDTTLAASVHEGAVDFSRYNMDTYSTIVNYKTAFYTFYLPVAIGMITSGVKDEASFTLAKNICCQMGHYFQVQDDFLDCYGDVETIGKGKSHRH